MKQKNRMAIVGGGAAGFFAAINGAQKAESLGLAVDIKIFESSNRYLKKVKISGGGRCNVTHNLFEVRPFCEHYPRGQRELLSPMQRFQAKDTVQWFEQQGVDLVAEEDGRMFPRSNQSQTIIDCYMDLVEKYKIQLLGNHAVEDIQVLDSGEFQLTMRNQKVFYADHVLIATGSSAGGYQLAESLGHTITDRAPSLFSFKIKDPLIQDLQGLSFHTSVKLKLPKKKSFKQEGPTLITHWGLSGPAILKLSAWAAREMKKANYQGLLQVNWLANKDTSDLDALLNQFKQDEPKSLLKNKYPQDLPKRFWLKLLGKLNIDTEKQWANLSKKESQSIVNHIVNSEFQILGQNRFKDEFVECGGVSLKEIDFKTMESKMVPNLYFAGELLDVDGITGGFNFQNAWTTGWLAAQSMLVKLENSLRNYESSSH